MIKINKKNPRIIIFRTDRIGDVVLSLQVAELLKQKFPASFLTFVVRKYTKPLLENNPFIDEILAIDDYPEKEFLELVRSKKFDISISLFTTMFSAKIPFLARIPVRIGPLSKIYSFFFFNSGVRQHRSQSIKNEAQYNIDLLKPLGIEATAYPKIYLSDDEILFGKNYFKNLGYDENKKLLILHPGSGGSSKDWSLKNYFELASELKSRGDFQVFFTGSREELANYKNIFPRETMPNELDMRKFLSVINRADIFVSNSTGPLHCAVALGVKTISFYPPIRVCKPLRWGPFSGDKSQNFVFTPAVKECEKCSTNCRHYFCMDEITVADVLEKIYATIHN